VPDGWEWDSTLFEGSAEYYVRGRLPYAPGFEAVLAAALGLDGRGRLLDVGCGPGTVTLPLAPWFEAVVGLDPDAGMLAEAARQGERLGVVNASWVTGRAEDLPAGLGEFRVVSFAQSFHWMDRDLVAATARGMLAPGGALVHVSDAKEVPVELSPLPHPAPPHDWIGALIQAYLGPVRRAGQGTLAAGTPDGEDAVLARAGFGRPERLVVPADQIVTRSVGDLMAWVFSLSYAAPHLFGDRLADFDRDLRALLRDTAPDGLFAERLPATDIRIWRRTDRGAQHARTS
jgi:SAM-dependent methyltransferase